MRTPVRLPEGRTHQQVENHFLVERAIASRLKVANRAERAQIYAGMYDELFARVPDHPRLTRRASEEQTRVANAEKMAIVRSLLAPSAVFVEFAPGDCRFAIEVAKHVKQVYAVDISDQRAPRDTGGSNLTFVVYDGYQLDAIPAQTADVVFSDHLVEHLHPEDVVLHFSTILGLLKPGASYIFRTPHVCSGPHDVSQYFSDVPEGFHLKEWSLRELEPVLAQVGYSRITPVWRIGTTAVAVPRLLFRAYERMIAPLQARSRSLARTLLPSICVIATK